LASFGGLLLCCFCVTRRRREDRAKDCSDEVVHPPNNQVVFPVENTGVGRGEPGGLWVGGNCSRKVSVIGRTYRGSLPSQAGQHEEEEKGENVNRTSLEPDQMYKMRLKLDDGQFVKGDNWGWKDKNQSENGPGQYGGNQSENGDSEIERDEKDSLYLGGDLSREKIGSLCSVCSRSISSITPPESLVHSGSRSTTPPPSYHFSPSSPRPSLFQCRECCFDNSPLSSQLVAIPAFPSPSLREEAHSEKKKKRFKEEEDILKGDGVEDGF